MNSDELTPSETESAETRTEGDRTDAAAQLGAESRRDAQYGTDPTGTDMQQAARGVATQAAFGDGVVGGPIGGDGLSGLEQSVEERGDLAHEGEPPAQGERD